MPERRYKFSWDFIGDIETGRPNLGNTTRVEIYRLFQFTLRNVMEEEFGSEKTDWLLYKSGYLAGTHFCEKFVGHYELFGDYIAKVQEVLEELNVGILRIEKANLEASLFTLTIAEDLNSSGLPDMGHEVCTYNEGFVAAIFKLFSGQDLDVKEVDCWCTDDRTCRFEIKPKE